MPSTSNKPELPQCNQKIDNWNLLLKVEQDNNNSNIDNVFYLDVHPQSLQTEQIYNGKLNKEHNLYH